MVNSEVNGDDITSNGGVTLLWTSLMFRRHHGEQILYYLLKIIDEKGVRIHEYSLKNNTNNPSLLLTRGNHTLYREIPELVPGRKYRATLQVNFNFNLLNLVIFLVIKFKLKSFELCTSCCS